MKDFLSQNTASNNCRHRPFAIRMSPTNLMDLLRFEHLLKEKGIVRCSKCNAYVSTPKEYNHVLIRILYYILGSVTGWLLLKAAMQLMPNNKYLGTLVLALCFLLCFFLIDKAITAIVFSLFRWSEIAEQNSDSLGAKYLAISKIKKAKQQKSDSFCTSGIVAMTLWADFDVGLIAILIVAAGSVLLRAIVKKRVLAIIFSLSLLFAVGIVALFFYAGNLVSRDLYVIVSALSIFLFSVFL